MPTVQSNGINLYCESSGEGEPLVLIAGLGYGLWMWHKMTPGLARHFEVIAFDNRGAGQTDKPSGPYSVQMLAADTVGLLDALGVEKAHIVGHSMGGFVAQELAITYPHRVNRLVLSSTNFGGPNHIPVTPEALAVMADRSGDPIDLVRRGIAVACAPGFADQHPELVEEMIRYRLGNPVPPEAYQAQMAVGLGLLSAEAAFEGHLHRVTAPTLILAGEHDRVVPPGNAGLLSQRIPGSRQEIIPDAGHLFPIEQPEAAVLALVRFLH
jgi:pimeloyl-ACP methyl ester carboxylesterase